MPIDIELDEHWHLQIRRARSLRKSPDCIDTIGNYLETCCASQQRKHVRKFRRRYADCINDVADAMSEEVLGLLERRDGDAALRVAQRTTHDIDRLRRLHVRTQHLSLIHISEPTRLLSISY